MKILFFCLLSSVGFSATHEILVSFSILKDITENIVPSEIKVKSLVAAGLDSHGYAPTARDFLELKKATHVLLVGENFEPWAEKSLARIKSNAKVYYVTKGLPLLPLLHDHHQSADSIGQQATASAKAATSEHHHFHQHTSHFDPHVWQSPRLVSEMIERLSKYLQGQFPVHQGAIQKRTADYLKQLKTLQATFQKSFSEIPLDRRKMILPHNSFEYFSKEFQVEVDSVLDPSQSGEPSLQKVASLAQKIKKEKIKSLFLEKSSPQGLIKSLSKETGVPISGMLYSDCLSESGEASTYLKMLESNFNLILKSMKVSVP